jgi:hypothetical protein
MAMEEHRVSSIEDYIATVRDIRTRWDRYDPSDYTEIWYRGVKDADLLLLPGAYWRDPCDEISLVLSFRALAPMLVQREPEDDWDWYFLMQHYGLPTRLLDWTESPLHGLHFALNEERDDLTPCVWVLDPTALNHTAQGSGHEVVYVPTTDDRDEPFTQWLPAQCGRGMSAHQFKKGTRYNFKSNQWPLAIYAKRTNPRIFAQRGVFTVHGTEEIPLEALQISNSLGEERLARILIEPASLKSMLADLYILGFSTTQTYPEPESISKDLKRMYKLNG